MLAVLLREVTIDGCAGYSEHVGDLLDRVLSGVVELLGELRLVGGEAWSAAAYPAAGVSALCRSTPIWA